MTTNARPPPLFSWCIADEGFRTSRTKSQTSPGIIISVNVKVKFDRLEPFYRALSYWVGCLDPLISPTQSRVDNLEVKLAVLPSEVFQLVQPGEQLGCWFIRVLTEGLGIGLSE